MNDPLSACVEQLVGTSAHVRTLEKLEAFCALTERWNRAFNLVSRQDIHRLRMRHVFDSLQAAALLRGEDVADIGSGGGFPGIPLAIVAPSRNFVLIDASGRKIRFLQQAVLELGLRNVSVQQARAPWSEGEFDCVVARAVGKPRAVIELAEPMLAPAGRLVIFAPIDAGDANMRIESVRSYEIPGIPGVRHLSVLQPMREGNLERP